MDLVRNNKGVTLASLSVYIIVSIVVLSSLTFLNINYMSQIAELSTKSQLSNELLKAKSYLINDVKSANRVLQYSEKYLKLDNGVEYTVKYRANEKQGEQTYDVYELYKGNVLITDKMANLSFDYKNSYNEMTKEIETEWVIVNMIDANLEGGKMYLKVGKGY